LPSSYKDNKRIILATTVAWYENDWLHLIRQKWHCHKYFVDHDLKMNTIIICWVSFPVFFLLSESNYPSIITLTQ
jgi:hypothetical protein